MGVLHPPGQDLQELLGDARMLKNRADCVAVYRGRSYLAERGRASHSRAGIQHRRGDEDFLRSQDGEHRSPERRCTTELYALRDDDVEIVCGVSLGVNLNLLCCALGKTTSFQCGAVGTVALSMSPEPSHPATSPTGSASTLPSSTGMWFTMDPSCWRAALCEIPSPAQPVVGHRITSVHHRAVRRWRRPSPEPGRWWLPLYCPRCGCVFSTSTGAADS